LVYEHSAVFVGQEYATEKQGAFRCFEDKHLQQLAFFLTQNPNCNYFKSLHKKVQFTEFVGVIKVGDLTIEVLPKTDKHQLDKGEWQGILLEMLLVSLQVKAKTTTLANVSLRQHSVLDTYLHLFIDEAEQLTHKGLVKKYRTNVSNQQSLKGKLLVHKQITKNAVHAERFYVAHTIYDRDNVYNYIVRAGLECVVSVGSESIKRKAESLLLYFPECSQRSINEKLFQTLAYDRKTEGYKRGIELARIRLLNYHPDIKGGSNDILAIMFDMNYLWESFIYWSLRRAAKRNSEVSISAQRSKVFWKKRHGWSMRLKPDLELSFTDGSKVILDTKWKYQSKVTPDDLRQLYAYLHYFESHQGYLLYPDKEPNHVRIESGNFWAIDANEPDDRSCGLMFADLINDDNMLNKKIGEVLIDRVERNMRSLH
jgi:5-methylcytosine-specific restriction enzyme subunit McrC